MPCEQKTQVSFSSLGSETCPTLCIWFLTAGEVVPAVSKRRGAQVKAPAGRHGILTRAGHRAAYSCRRPRSKVASGSSETDLATVCSLTPWHRPTQGAAVNSDADRQPEGEGGSQAGELPAVAWPCLWQYRGRELLPALPPRCSLDLWQALKPSTPG